MIYQYKDLREWIKLAEELGELKRIKGADWNLEVSALSELIREREWKKTPSVLFDEIKDYPAGYRILTNPTESLVNLALTLRMPSLDYSQMEFVKAWREKSNKMKPIPPRVVKDGPILENVYKGNDINILQFPAPRWQELDGGRYIGTGHSVITRDPDDGWVNMGTYRVQVFDGTTLSCMISHAGKHGAIHRQKYFAKGKPCPVAMSFGHDPLNWVVSAMDVPFGLSEYDYMGGVRGEPVDVIIGDYTGLPIPADSEIAIEGEFLPEEREEGPFGEFTGYYAGGIMSLPIIKIKRIMHRNSPILLGLTRMKSNVPRIVNGLAPIFSGFHWDAMAGTGLPGIEGVWDSEIVGGMLTVVSIKQMGPGHAKKLGLLALSCRPSGWDMGRYVILVDEDIDPSNWDQVLWAIATRSDPARSIDIIRRCPTTPLDPAIRPKEKTGLNSVAIIDACRPYEWKDEFAPVVELSEELREKTLKKWKGTLDSLFK